MTQNNDMPDVIYAMKGLLSTWWNETPDVLGQTSKYIRADKIEQPTDDLKRKDKVIALAAACMLKPNNGITDTVWLDDYITLYEHLVSEIEVEITGDVDVDIKTLEEFAK